MKTVPSNFIKPGAQKHRETELHGRLVSGSYLFRVRLVLGAVLLLVSGIPQSRAGIVYESPAEFLASGDFNGDGIPDVLALDKTTGNARVGYQDTNGVLHWSAPLVTGAENATGCGIGKFLQSSRDAVAVTSPGLNRINLVDLSNTNAAGLPVVITAPGVGPHSLTGLKKPLGGAGTLFDHLLSASSLNNFPNERLDLTSFSLGASNAAGQFTEIGSFARPNSLQLGTNTFDFAIGLVRGTNDTLHLWQFTNAPGVLTSYASLPSLSDYTVGRFNGETLPRFAFYVPGQSNISIVPLTNSSSAFSFGPQIAISFSNAIQGVYYVAGTNGDGSFQVQFGDGVQGVRLPGNSPVLGAAYHSGSGATGLVPLTNDRFALLTASTGTVTSVHAQVMQYVGNSYIQISAGDLPTVSSHSTRANVWLFQREPFVSSAPGFIASISSPDWSTLVTGLPGNLSVRKESDAGTSSGLGNTGTNNLGAPPQGAAYGVPDQYLDSISLFSYSSPRAAEPVAVTISPAPGTYPGPIQVSFSTLNLSDRIFYRIGATNAWQQYSAVFKLTNDTTVQYYGTNSTGNVRSSLLSAMYILASNNKGPEPPQIVDPSASTNTTPVFNTNQVNISYNGTIFYSRRSGTAGSIWSIDLSGAGDDYITTGIRPRVSHDGQWMAFLREGAPFAGSGNIWVRNLASGLEQRILVNTNSIVSYDWDLTGTNLVIDYACKLWRLALNGSLTPLPLNENCADVAPVVNLQDGRLAYFNLNPNALNPGISVSTPGLPTGVHLNINVPGASWPSWSPDGQNLVFVDGNNYSSFDKGTNLYLIHPDGTGLHQMTRFGAGANGFPHGAIWSPSGDALVGAGTVNGTNGLYVLPLFNDICACTALRLATIPGDPIDFVGSIATAAAPQPQFGKPGLFIRLDPNDVVVYWSTNYVGYVLEAAGNAAVTSLWSTVNGPYLESGFFYEHREAKTNLLARQFFRLRYGGLALNLPTLTIHVETNQLVINWPTNATGFMLESKTNVSASTPWTTVSSPYTISGGMFEKRKAHSAQPQEFFRLRKP